MPINRFLYLNVPFNEAISVSVGGLHWECSTWDPCWVLCCLGVHSLLSPGWLVFDKEDVPNNFKLFWYGRCWDIPENQKVELNTPEPGLSFLTVVLYQGPSTHMICQMTIIDEKMLLQSYFYPPTPSECQHNLLQTLLRARTGCSRGSQSAQSSG